MDQSNQVLWRFPEMREAVQPKPAAAANASSLVPTPIVYPEDHDPDDWCECAVCWPTADSDDESSQ